MFNAAAQGKRCLVFTTLSEPALKLIRHMQLFSFFDEALLDDQIDFVDLGDLVRQAPENAGATIAARAEAFAPDFVAIDSFRALCDMLSTDRFLFEARSLVESLQAKRVVFDSLSSMAIGVSSERRFKELVYSIAKHMRRTETTVVMTLEAEQIIGSGTLTGDGISFVADTLIQLRYLEIDGKLERALSVLKARGTHHVSELRALTITRDGFRVSDRPFDNLRGVLTGVPTRTQ